MTEKSPWHEYCLREIDECLDRGKRMSSWEKEFYSGIKRRVHIGLALTCPQETALVKLHKKMTEISRIKW